MLRVKINGRLHEFEELIFILQALRRAAIELPTLCHDDRLKPYGACRLCLVAVEGSPRFATACNTPISDGMEIKTDTAALREERRGVLSLLAYRYPPQAVDQAPEKQLHRYFHDYGIAAKGSDQDSAPFIDDSHPYIQVDMSRCIACYRCVRICAEVQGQFVWQVCGRGAETRIVADSRADLRNTACVSCGACVDTCPTGALEDKAVVIEGPPGKWTKTICVYCGAGCEMNVGTRDGKIISIRPVLDAPVNKGHLCVKGRYAFAYNAASDRVTVPMIRDRGVWTPVSWDDAIAVIAAGFKRSLEKYGPQSVAVLGSARATNEENYVAQKFARAVLGTNNVDCCARVCHAPSAAAMKTMLGTGAATNSLEDIERARTILVCGANATENHPVVGARIKQQALGGANLIVIDPRAIELARLARIHLALRPGTNLALLNALAHVIVEEELYDKAWVHERVSGFDEFRAFLHDWTPERAETICGVGSQLIREAARLYATQKPSMCFHGLGLTEHTQGTEGVMALINLALLTGNIGKAGSGINPLRGQNNVQGSAHMGCEPDNLTGYVSLPENKARFETVWHAPLPAGKGLNLMQMIDAAGEGKLKALWAIGYDVVLTNANAAATKKALANLDLLIVQDLFLNETARECGTVFLPAASFFEKDGTFMNGERRVQRVRKVFDPPGQAWSDWEIVCALARAMGKGKLFPYNSAESIWNEVREVWKPGAGISYERIERTGLQWPCPAEDHPGSPILHRDSFPHGKTAALSRIPYRPTAETTSEEFPFLLTTGRTLYHFNAGTMTLRTRNAELHKSDFLDISPPDAERLRLRDEETVRVRSRYGESRLPLRITSTVKPGELFATFHTSRVFLNQVTNGYRDAYTLTPQYKVTAVRIEKA